MIKTRTLEHNKDVHKAIALDAGTEINIFVLTGAVKLTRFHAEVTEIITSAGAPTMHISVFSANGEVDITDDPGPNIKDDVVGTVYVRTAAATVALTKGENDNTPFLVENAAYKDPETEVIIGADDAATTYVRFNSNAALTDGTIDWHCHWEPITDNGNLVPA